MKKSILLLFVYLTLISTAKAELGINAGLGLPFVSQYGLNLTMGDKWSLNVGYNNLSFTLGSAKTSLTMPEALLNWHPFAGSFFIGLGVGQETLVVTATDADTNAEATAKVTASTTIMKLGWMWGKANGGFWFGMDIAYISPSGGEVEIETSGGTPSDGTFQDVEDSGEKFGETAYTNITFARFGYLF